MMEAQLPRRFIVDCASDSFDGPWRSCPMARSHAQSVRRSRPWEDAAGRCRYRLPRPTCRGRSRSPRASTPPPLTFAVPTARPATVRGSPANAQLGGPQFRRESFDMVRADFGRGRLREPSEEFVGIPSSAEEGRREKYPDPGTGGGERYGRSDLRRREPHGAPCSPVVPRPDR